MNRVLPPIVQATIHNLWMVDLNREFRMDQPTPPDLQHQRCAPLVGDRVRHSTRYQGAIIRDHQILLLKQVEHASGRSYWQIPGGRVESDETEEQCVQREMLEETGLSVQVDSLLLDEPSPPGSTYQRWKTYRCSILAGEARPGSEPEAIYANAYSFIKVEWFDLRHPTAWNTRIEADSFIYAWLQRIQAVLGYTVVPDPQDSTEGLV
jgi:8-oxo-dGTP pyrophosphatase MutT (NUDIX family)